MNTTPALVLGLSLVLASAVVALGSRSAPPGTSGSAELTGELTQVKSEFTQAKNELTQVKNELTKLRAPQGSGQGGRYQLFMDSKGEAAYLFDPVTGQLLKSGLRGGPWTVAAWLEK